MNRLLRALIVEDAPDDALLLVEALRRQGFDTVHERVEDPNGMRAALQRREWDVIISDFSLPRFSAPAALYLMRQLGLDLPFIIVSGVIGEESAVSALKAGAHDFILKGSYARLGTSIEREIREAEVRREARRVKAVLLESEAYFRALAENSSDLITILNHDLTVRYHSPSVERLLGYRPEELVGTSGLSRVHPEDVPRLERVLRAALSGLQAGSEVFRIHRKDGSWRIHEAVGRNLLDNPAVRGIVINSRDVTERVEAQDALKRSEARYRGIMETAEEGIALTDADGTTQWVNEKLCRMLGRTLEDVLASPTSAFMDAENDAIVRRENELRRAGRRSQYELQFTRPDGSPLWVLVNASPIMGENGEFLGSVAMMTDITHRWRAEELIRKSEVYYRSLIERMSDLVLLLDAEGRCRYATPSVAAVLGFTPEEALGRDLFDMIHPDDHARVRELFAEVLRGRGEIRAAEYRFRHKNGTWRTLQSTGTNLLEEPAVRGVVINTRDITEQRGLERRLQQSQRLDAIGRLAGGMAHDFNNILTVIRASAEFVLEGLEEGDARRADASEILRSADRAAALTRQLLAFSKRQVLQPRVLDINTVVQDLERMLRRLISEDVVLVMDRSPDSLTVRADPAQVEQVIMNLVVNAREAMPAGGRLDIRTRAVVLGEGDLGAQPGCPPGRYVEIAVTDSGCGMSAEVRERIFEPFFTTKERGTGLGLPMVYGIAQQSGGFIAVESEVGRGTTFTVYLPEVVGEGRDSGETAAPPVESRGHEVVLLTEDDPAVRALAHRSLERLGYQVLDAGGADAALELARTHEGPIDLLLTDFVMPGRSGRELAVAFAELRPEARVAYMSGYADRALEGGLPPDAVLVEKPFTPTSLGAKVREALGVPARA